MKRIIVFSDSHGDTAHMCAVLEKIIGVDMIIHCGDYSKDALYLRNKYKDIPVISVRGNNEFGDILDNFHEIVEVDGVKIFVAHGHIQNVKRGYETLAERAKNEGCNLALFGHTHSAFCGEVSGVKLLNPGAAGDRFGSYGVVEIENGKAGLAVIDIN